MRQLPLTGMVSRKIFMLQEQVYKLTPEQQLKLWCKIRADQVYIDAGLPIPEEPIVKARRVMAEKRRQKRLDRKGDERGNT